MDNISELIDRYSDMIAQLDAIRLRFQDLRDSLITDEIKEQFAEINAEEQTALSALNEGLEKLEKQIKQMVLISGETQEGEFHQFRFVQGRTTWNTKLLEGYAVADPKLMALKKIGKPTVSIYKK